MVLVLSWPNCCTLQRWNRPDGAGESQQEEGSATEDAGFEGDVLERLVKARIFGEKTFGDGKNFGEDGKDDGLESEGDGSRSIRVRCARQG